MVLALTVSIPVILAGDAVCVLLGVAWAKGWLQRIPGLFKSSKAAVETVATDVKAEAAKVEVK